MQIQPLYHKLKRLREDVVLPRLVKFSNEALRYF